MISLLVVIIPPVIGVACMQHVEMCCKSLEVLEKTMYPDG